jgi:hypothetical protein
MFDDAAGITELLKEGCPLALLNGFTLNDSLLESQDNTRRTTSFPAW